MHKIPEKVRDRYLVLLGEVGLKGEHQGECLKWLRFYLDFCLKYEHEPRLAASLSKFEEKLKSKGQGVTKREQAHWAVRLFQRDNSSVQATAAVPASPASGPSSRKQTTSVQSSSTAGTPACSWETVLTATADSIHRRHLSPRTLSTYMGWIRRFQTFTGSKDPNKLDDQDVRDYLTYLAKEKQVAAATQNQAFNSLLCFFRHGLEREFGELNGVERAKKKKRIPVVLSQREVNEVLNRLTGDHRLIVGFLYGCGLRIGECLELRLHCFDLEQNLLTIHDGKGGKDRVVPLPRALRPAIEARFETVAGQLRQDQRDPAFRGVFLPKRLGEKYASAALDLGWQWFFPAPSLTKVPETGELRRYHAYPAPVNKAIRKATQEARVLKRVSAHTFRHSYASHLLAAGTDIRTIQGLLGHSDVKTTMIYTHTIPVKEAKTVVSPLDLISKRRGNQFGKQ